MAVKTKLIHQKAENNFTFRPAPSLPQQEQTNAAFEQYHILQDWYWNINPRNSIEIHYWYSTADREIPPTIVQNKSLAHQADQASRLMASWENRQSKGITKSKIAFFNEQLRYQDPQIILDAPSQFWSLLGEVTHQSQWKENTTWLGGINFTLNQAETNNYSAIPQEIRSSLFSTIKYSSRKFKGQFSLRQTLIDDQLIPILPAVGFEYQLLPWFEVLGKLSRNYRFPTLNDQYWIPGGNTELLPESGWSEELSVNLSLNGKHFAFNPSLTFYNRQIENWVLWGIRAGESFYSANNLAEVWSRGLEARMALGFTLNKCSLNWDNQYHYTRSTNQVSIEQPRIRAGDQLPYTPIHRALTGLSINYGPFSGLYHHQWNGPTQGINEAIDAYHFGTLTIGYQTKLKEYAFQLSLQINNLWDSRYFIIERRPMPGRHFSVGIQIGINKKHVI